jgi:hypothetical protein
MLATVLGFARGRRLPRAKFRKIPKNFFFACVRCGLGSRAGESATKLRGSFRPPNSGAGGNRARGR